MQAVIGYFEPRDVESIRASLVSAGFRSEDILELTTIDEVPEFLEGEPEEAASRGWLFGAIISGLIGAVAGWLMAITFNQSIIFSVLMGAAGAAVLGGYLSSLYTVRANTKVGMDIHEALSDDMSLVLVRVGDDDVEAATAIMEHYHNEGIDAYPIPKPEVGSMM
ncbi:MAG: hypothetical protein R6X18_02575 [Chloroflexota bacterium]|jgi:uncharacterized membrane protein YeaQ/YmgE (transglycosylase-associated protein family)